MITPLSIDRIHFYYEGEIHILEVESFNLKDFHRFPNLSLELIISKKAKEMIFALIREFN